MASFYRPSDFTIGAPGDSPGGVSKAGELASAKVETQLNNRADITAAHKFFQPAMDVSKIALPIMPSDAGAAHAASQQVSPLIQMIMKMPGHIGVLNSFFEALSAFFKPEHWFNFLDPHYLAHQAHASLNHSLSAAEHLPISLSLLPHNAPIFSSLGPHAELSSLPAVHVEMRLHDMPAMGRDHLNCSGTLDIKKPQFETTSYALDGRQIEPSVSGPQVANDMPHSALSSNQRLFSDRIDSVVAGQHKSVLNAANSNSANLGSRVASTATPASLSSSLNVGASPYGQSVEGLPAAIQGPEALTSGPSLSQNVSFHLGAAGQTHLDVPSDLGPSGAVSDKLGGQNVASVETVSAKPNVLDAHLAPEAHMSSVAQSPVLPASGSHSVQGAQPASSITGLKAKSLALNAFERQKLNCL